jgi:hypothetical protein
MAMGEALAAIFFRAKAFPSWPISRRILDFYLSTLFPVGVYPG